VSVLAVIPARLGAVRLPEKPLRNLAGAPLIVRVWERVVAMGVADRVVVATESDAVAAVVARAGGECVLTSPEHLSGTDRVAEVAASAPFHAFDIVVNIQGDEAFVGGDAVRGAIALVAAGTFPLGTAAAVADSSILAEPSAVKVVCGDDGRALYFSRAPIPYLRDASDHGVREPLIRLHLGVYAYTRPGLAAWVALPPHPLELSERLEQLRPLAAGWGMGVAVVSEPPRMGGIDTEADLERAQALWPVAQGGDRGGSQTLLSEVRV
jgi:3-deoxy-manno-octulosonate cytidylyltransferase (CMP-KDO synthetase)